MKSSIISSVALAASVASAAVPCYVDTIAVDASGATPIPIGELVVYTGAVLTGVTCTSDGTTSVPVTDITGGNGAVEFVDNKLTVRADEAGTITGTAAGFDSITINGDHKWAKFFYKSSEAVDFFQSATTMTGGNPSTGEYFTDDSTNPIHLYADAKETNSVEQNWYVVSDEPSPPALNLVSGAPTVNSAYTPYAPESNSMPIQADVDSLKTQYGALIDFPFWFPNEGADSQEPKVVGNDACPNGMVTAVTAYNSGTNTFDSAPQGAHIPAFVLSTVELVSAVTTPVPNGGSTTSSSTTPPTDQTTTTTTPSSDQTTTTTTPSSDQTTTTTTPSSDQTTTTTTTSPGITSSAVSRAVVTGLTAVLGLLLF